MNEKGSHGAYVVVEKIDIKQVNRKHHLVLIGAIEKNHTGKEKENDWEKGDTLDKVPWEGIPKDITCKQTPEW